MATIGSRLKALERQRARRAVDERIPVYVHDGAGRVGPSYISTPVIDYRLNLQMVAPDELLDTDSAD